MQTALPRTRVSLVAALALAWACGGEANKPGAATVGSSTGATSTAAGDINAGARPGVDPTEAVAFMAAADQSEVEAAQIALRKAANAEVRQFAQQMQRDHSKAAREDNELAKKMNVDLKASGNQGAMVTNLHSMAQQTAQQLNGTPKGTAFDRTYMDSQVQAHQTVLENLQRIAGSGGTASYGAAGASAAAKPAGSAGRVQSPSTPQEAAQKMIPIVQQHLEKARQIQSRVGR